MNACSTTPEPVTATAKPSALAAYPAAPRGDVVDDYHGTKVPDPYRWLEDPDAPAVRDWIDAENRLTQSFLSAVGARDSIHKRLRALWDYERYGLPQREGGRYFFRKNDGLQNQSVLYTTHSLDAEAKVLLDPNTLSPDGTVALDDSVPSPDGRYLAYGLASAGSDWVEWKVRDIESGADLDDHIRWSKFSGASWTADSAGFFYSAYDAPAEGAELEGVNYFQKLYYHRLGTPQAEDELVYHDPEHKEWGFAGEVSDDGRWLIITAWKGTDDTALVFYKDLKAKGAEVTGLIEAWESGYSFIDSFTDKKSNVLLFKTDKDAARGRVVAIDLKKPEPEHWKELIPEAEETLMGVDVVGQNLVASYLKDAASRVRVFGLDGTFVREVELPGLGTVYASDGKRGDPETFYSFTSFTTPTTIYRYDVAADASKVYRQPKVEFDASAYETKQVFYQSKDGTKVPMFITHKKGLALDGNNPTYLYGYGGFDISITPEFDVSRLVWLELGGVFAVANIRGGGEYGEAWHAAGTKERKQNVFDDFIAGAEWLIANRYTSPKKLAISGRSNGGLLVAACMTQRPDLFGAVLPAVGVMDMLRFHKFTIGWAWTDDYGSPDDPTDLRALHAYSPYHNVQAGTAYPPTFLTTADHDDRVVPAHSFKLTAALQAAQAGSNPILIRIETKAGHGAGKPTEKIIDELADIYAFLIRVLDVSVPDAEQSKVAEASAAQ